MKNIFKIFFSDLKSILWNRVAVLIILVICILPSLYARFYLKSSWDPYGHTKWIKVAVVNNDIWVNFQWKYINIWKEVVDELKENDDIWRVFVEEDIAQEWTRLGQYYANIVIETWFSEKFITVLDENPTNPQLHYTVNEKLNAIAPKITNMWTSAIKENIEKRFTKTVEEVVMWKLNEIGATVQNDKSSIYSFIDIVHKINNEVEWLDDVVDSSIRIAKNARNKLQELDNNMPNVYNAIDDSQVFLSDVQWISKDSLNLLNKSSKNLKRDFSDIESTLKSIDNQADPILAKLDKGENIAVQDLEKISSECVVAKWKVDNLISNLQEIKTKLNEISSNIPWTQIITKSIDRAIPKLESIKDKLNNIIEIFGKISNDTKNIKNNRNKLKSNINEIDSDLDDVSNELDKNIIPWLKNILSELYDLAGIWKDTLGDFENNELPGIQNDINSGIDVLDDTIDKLEDFRRDVPMIQSNVSKLDKEMQSIKNDWMINEFLSVATLDPERFANFFSAPIELVEHKLFSIPNYGSAMAPFFTTLAIWVWGLLMIAMFSTRVKNKKFEACKRYEKFFWKYLFFLMISIVQWLIVWLWNIRFLWVYVENIWAYIGAFLSCSLVFSMIAYSCVHTFGNAGKAIMILLLVLQLSGSGWTFPVEMSDPFFQTINPYLPFTYAIKIMREATWWVVPQIYYMNLLIFLWFFGLFAIIWLVIRPLIAKYVSKFDNKFAELEIIEH